MKIETKQQNEELIASLYGELNEEAAPEAKRTFDILCDDKNVRILILDFANVSFMNSTGIGVILRLYRELNRRGKKLFIANPNRQIDKVISLSGLYSVIERISMEV